MAGWVEGHEGRLTTVTVPCPRLAGKMGRQGICLASMHMGNYEPKAVLVELGVGCERARRKGSNDDWGASGLAGLVRACEQQPEREGERHDERRECVCEREKDRGADILASAGPGRLALAVGHGGEGGQRRATRRKSE